jgi:hypothetical protein
VSLTAVALLIVSLTARLLLSWLWTHVPLVALFSAVVACAAEGPASTLLAPLGILQLWVQNPTLLGVMPLLLAVLAEKRMLILHVITHVRLLKQAYLLD